MYGSCEAEEVGKTKKRKDSPKMKLDKCKKKNSGRELPLPWGRISPNSDQQLAPETGPFHWAQRHHISLCNKIIEKT